MKTEWRLVEKFGKTYAQCRDATCADGEWASPLFPVVKNRETIYQQTFFVWEESIGMYRRKFAID